MRNAQLGILLLGTCLLFASEACGETAESTSNASDAGGERAASADASADAPPTARDAGTTIDAPTASRCDGGTVDAAACDWSRIVPGGIAACARLGAYCDQLMYSVPVASDGGPGAPASFTCRTELGVRTCVYYAGDAGTSHVTLDEAALRAACDVTAALPAAQVVCVVYD